MWVSSYEIVSTHENTESRNPPVVLDEVEVLVEDLEGQVGF